MDIVILIGIIVASIAQQLLKTNKDKKKVSSPREILEDIFPDMEPDTDLEVECAEEPYTWNDQPTAKQVRREKTPPEKKNIPHTPLTEHKETQRSPLRLSTREEARRAFLYSEIFNRKYN